VNLKRKRRKALMAAAAPTLAPVTHAQGFVVIGIDAVGNPNGIVYDEILTDNESHEAGRDRAKAKLRDLLTSEPPDTCASYMEYDETGNAV
jgi:hypothetical protein